MMSKLFITTFILLLSLSAYAEIRFCSKIVNSVKTFAIQTLSSVKEIGNKEAKQIKEDLKLALENLEGSKRLFRYMLYEKREGRDSVSGDLFGLQYTFGQFNINTSRMKSLAGVDSLTTFNQLLTRLKQKEVTFEGLSEFEKDLVRLGVIHLILEYRIQMYNSWIAAGYGRFAKIEADLSFAEYLVANLTLQLANLRNQGTPELVEIQRNLKDESDRLSKRRSELSNVEKRDVEERDRLEANLKDLGRLIPGVRYLTGFGKKGDPDFIPGNLSTWDFYSADETSRGPEDWRADSLWLQRLVPEIKKQVEAEMKSGRK